jgi:Family of unknown function (DUF5681)
VADTPLQIRAKRAGRGRPFEKGRSGNPAGRPRGSTNRATKSAVAMLDGEAEALTRKAVELALGGDASALRLCLERIVGPRRGRPVELALPAIRSAAEAPARWARLLPRPRAVPSPPPRRSRWRKSSIPWCGRSRPATSTAGYRSWRPVLRRGADARQVGGYPRGQS